MQRFVPFFVGIFVFVADFISKYITNSTLPVMRYESMWYPYGGIGIFKDFFGIEFSISHQINHGAAWGIFADFQIYLLYLRIALIIGLLVYALFLDKHKAWGIPLALIIAGATGNVVDYFIYGHVVDMLHFVLWRYDFPVFNLADTSIFLGISSLILISSFEKNGPNKRIANKYD